MLQPHELDGGAQCAVRLGGRAFAAESDITWASSDVRVSYHRDEPTTGRPAVSLR